MITSHENHFQFDFSLQIMNDKFCCILLRFLISIFVNIINCKYIHKQDVAAYLFNIDNFLSLPLF